MLVVRSQTWSETTQNTPPKRFPPGPEGETESNNQNSPKTRKPGQNANPHGSKGKMQPKIFQNAIPSVPAAATSLQPK